MVIFLVGKRKRVVVKIGTNLLIDESGVRDGVISSLTEAITSSKEEVIVVSSGAVGFGRRSIHAKLKHQDDVLTNVCAAVGQHEVMTLFASHFAEKKRKVAQLLVPQNDFSNRKTFLQVKAVIEEMLQRNIIPIINENDAIASRTNRFPDNDWVAMQIASKIDADRLVLLTNVDGVYDKDPRSEKDARVVSEFDMTTKVGIGKRNGAMSRGGMESKINSALLGSHLGIPIIIANGNEKEKISAAIEGSRTGTSFSPKAKIGSKRRWIMLAKEKGKISINQGACAALMKKMSLLAIGVMGVEGDFLPGDVVILSVDGKSIAKVITEVGSDALELIKGKTTQEIALLHDDYSAVARNENICLLEEQKWI